MSSDPSPAAKDPWAEARAAYCDTRESVVKLCARLGLGTGEFYKRVNLEAWPKRTARPGYVSPFTPRSAPRPGAAAALPIAPVAQPFAPPKRGPSARRLKRERTRADLARRLYDALIVKLTQLEDLMAKKDELSTIDQSRQTRAISALVNAFERVTEYDPELLNSTSVAGLAEPGTGHALAAPARDCPAAAGHTGSGTADAAATEQLRRDIASRIERLVAQRIAPRDAGGA